MRLGQGTGLGVGLGRNLHIVLILNTKSPFITKLIHEHPTFHPSIIDLIGSTLSNHAQNPHALLCKLWKPLCYGTCQVPATLPVLLPVQKKNQLILLGLPASCLTGSNPKYIIEVFLQNKNKNLILIFLGGMCLGLNILSGRWLY